MSGMIDYAAFNKEVFRKVPTNSIRILDIGCGTGAMGRALLEQQQDRILVGITYSEKEAAVARERYQEVIVHDLNNLKLELGLSYDCIILSHVLEHTYHPVTVLQHYCNYLAPNGIVIVALPNVLFFKQRFQFLRGEFKYSERGGFLDNTHFRFFDFETAKSLITDAGLSLRTAEGFGKFPLPVFRKLLPGFAAWADRLACRRFPGLFSFQYVLTATALPTSRQVSSEC